MTRVTKNRRRSSSNIFATTYVMGRYKPSARSRMYSERSMTICGTYDAAPNAGRVHHMNSIEEMFTTLAGSWSSPMPKYSGR